MGNLDPRMRRKGLSGDSRYPLDTERVQASAVWWCRADAPDHQLFVFARDDDYFFGVLHSRCTNSGAGTMDATVMDLKRPPSVHAHHLLRDVPAAVAAGTGAGRFADRAAISEAARVLNEHRENWLNPRRRAMRRR